MHNNLICTQQFHLRQVNEVNGRDSVRSMCLCVRSEPFYRSSLKWELNANSSKTVKGTDFKFDTRVPRDTRDMKP